MQVAVNKINLLLGIKNFLSTDEPEVFWGEEILEICISLEVHLRNGDERYSSETLRFEKPLDLLVTAEVERAEENLPVFVHGGFIDSAISQEGINHVFIFGLNLQTVVAPLLNIENHDDIVRAGIREHKVHVLLWSKIDNTVAGFRFFLLHSLNFDLSHFVDHVLSEWGVHLLDIIQILFLLLFDLGVRRDQAENYEQK